MGGLSCYIGWDVGGWNCDRNAKSRDAIVILDEKLKIVGKPWRGNLRDDINNAATTREWIGALFSRCKATMPDYLSNITMAIDTPLGFSKEFVALITKAKPVDEIGESFTNRYLYRQTERYLFGIGLKPLSSIKDMIGSQTTKGMHVLARFAPKVERCGVWTDGKGFRAIEAYPSACKKSKGIKALRRKVKMQPGTHVDVKDALTCALVAYLFKNKTRELIAPPAAVSQSEGWIWVPEDI